MGSKFRATDRVVLARSGFPGACKGDEGRVVSVKEYKHEATRYYVQFPLAAVWCYAEDISEVR